VQQHRDEQGPEALGNQEYLGGERRVYDEEVERNPGKHLRPGKRSMNRKTDKLHQPTAAD
jgi:hypothetical protein